MKRQIAKGYSVTFIRSLEAGKMTLYVYAHVNFIECVKEQSYKYE